ncbi:MAG: response regulator transcription factor [Bacteroidetes bacterium]|nr:response regulator transcription factor [Bacteroidota bacterium]
MKLLIVDDNKIARSTLKQLASRVNSLSLVGEASDAMEAINIIRQSSPQLLLLDIEMPGMTGIELVRVLGTNRPLVIFTTSKKEYATDAFDLNVVDYLVKPVTPARFIQAITKAEELLEDAGTTLNVSKEDFLFIRDTNIIRKLNLDDILFAEAMGDYVKLHTPTKYYTVHSTLKALEERLDPEKFIRVHRSFIISIGKVDCLRDGIILIKEKPVPVADAYRAALNRKLRVL